MKAVVALLLAGKLGKFLATGGTMLLSIFTYAFVYGWRYAVGFVGLLFIHEMGHFLAARQRGLDVGAPTFIPFIGAWIQLKEQPLDAETEAFVGIAGPILGSAAAFVCYLVACNNGSSLLLALSYAGFVLNLFNLIPITPLDGGRIVSVVSPRIWLFGIPMLLGVFIWNQSPLLLLISVIAIPQAWQVLKNRDLTESAYYQADHKVRFQYAFQYLMLATLLSIMAFEVHEALRLK
ncbi:MAG: site-2 protease family protein [Candidatus Accumulibacter sp.]|uniref:site-2 protease family protein n=1 Tax=Accumulibacter sp. TaxID=2053492 RepID=UPI00287B0660|nr:site-2 protease family protein [Accumulibacter sp.]MDS4016316.1 site-2 protease family protein [Accumulibacter sp.]